MGMEGGQITTIFYIINWLAINSTSERAFISFFDFSNLPFETSCVITTISALFSLASNWTIDSIDTSQSILLIASMDLPEITLKFNEVEQGINILDFISKNKILSSKSEARRVIANKGFKIDDNIIEDEKKVIRLKDFKNNVFKLSYGKKKHYLVKII